MKQVFCCEATYAKLKLFESYLEEKIYPNIHRVQIDLLKKQCDILHNMFLSFKSVYEQCCISYRTGDNELAFIKIKGNLFLFIDELNPHIKIETHKCTIDNNGISKFTNKLFSVFELSILLKESFIPYSLASVSKTILIDDEINGKESAKTNIYLNDNLWESLYSLEYKDAADLFLINEIKLSKNVLSFVKEVVKRFNSDDRNYNVYIDNVYIKDGRVVFAVKNHYGNEFTVAPNTLIKHINKIIK